MASVDLGKDNFLQEVPFSNYEPDGGDYDDDDDESL
jgi:hypothetical protein